MPNTAIQNLVIAERTVNYVAQKMTLGASNKPEDLAHATMKRDAAFAQKGRLARTFSSKPAPDLVRGSVSAQRQNLPQEAGMSRNENILARAVYVEGTGIGNCGEQSAVGYRYLKELTSYNDTFCLVNIGKNHSFLLLGVSGQDAHGLHAISQAPNWPQSAVVCDPWYHEWFRVDQDWTRKIRSILGQTEPGWTQVQTDIKVIAEAVPA